MLELRSSPSGLGNLTKDQQRAYKKLQSYDDIIIKPSYKGGNIVIMNIPDYLDMCNLLIQNKQWYEPISLDEVQILFRDYYSLVDSALENSIISKPIWKFIKNLHPKTPTFLQLIKAA